MSGRFYTCGSNTLGQLGLKINASTPIAFTLQKVIDQGVSKAICGEEHTVLLMKDGSVLSAGSDQMKQLGRKESPGFGKVNIRAEVKDIQAWNMTACIDSNK